MVDQIIPESLYSQNLRAKNNMKTYFFDIREARNGIKFLTIAESKLTYGQRMRQYFTLSNEEVEEFAKIMQDMASKIKQ